MGVWLWVCVCAHVLSHEDMIWQYLPTHLFLFQHDVQHQQQHVLRGRNQPEQMDTMDVGDNDYVPLCAFT